MNKSGKIFITGHNGMVGSNLILELRKRGYNNLIYQDSKQLDLRSQIKVNKYFKENKPEYVFHLAAKVGGIKANISSPFEFINDNTLISINVINAAKETGVKKFLNLASSCIYPRLCPQPMKEKYLLTGKFEPTNEGYALAKSLSVKMCQIINESFGMKYISVLPPNLYGYNDHFDIEKSHVLTAIIRKVYNSKKSKAKFIELLGTGKARREFMFTSDVVDGMIYLMNKYSGPEPINLGTGEDIKIYLLAKMIMKKMDFKGEIILNEKYPDGMPRKLLDSTRVFKMGWKPKVTLEKGIDHTIEWFLKNYKDK